MHVLSGPLGLNRELATSSAKLMAVASCTPGEASTKGRRLLWLLWRCESGRPARSSPSSFGGGRPVIRHCPALRMGRHAPGRRQPSPAQRNAAWRNAPGRRRLHAAIRVQVGPVGSAAVLRGDERRIKAQQAAAALRKCQVDAEPVRAVAGPVVVLRPGGRGSRGSRSQQQLSSAPRGQAPGGYKWLILEKDGDQQRGAGAMEQCKELLCGPCQEV